MKMSYHLNEISKVITEVILPKLSTCRVFTFEGNLGAGKTTMVKEFLKLCGVADVVTSPTFAYVNIYEANGRKFHHFDLYRLNSSSEFIDLGFNEQLFGEDVVLIEWPGVISALLSGKELKGKVCAIKLSHTEGLGEIRELELIENV